MIYGDNRKVEGGYIREVCYCFARVLASSPAIVGFNSIDECEVLSKLEHYTSAFSVVVVVEVSDVVLVLVVTVVFVVVVVMVLVLVVVLVLVLVLVLVVVLVLVLVLVVMVVVVAAGGGTTVNTPLNCVVSIALLLRSH
jgi:hypothetical protein